jgi:hypothetical protein
MANDRLIPALLTAAGIVVSGALVGDAIRYTKRFESVVENSLVRYFFTIGAPLAEYEQESSIMKKVRVVTRVQYFLEK